MSKQVLWRSMLGLRAATAVLMIGGFLAVGARTASAQDDESTIDGNTYTGFNFDWSIEWDEDVWVDPIDDNTGGSDFLALNSADDQPIAFVTIFGVEEFGGDPDLCAESYLGEVLEQRDGASDVAEATDVDLPRVPRDQANAAYSYTLTTDSGDVDAIDYVVCQTLVEDEAVLLAWVTTSSDDFDGAVEIFGELLDSVEIGGGSSADDGDEDEDVTPEADDEEDEDVTPEADDEGQDEDEDADAEPTRDVLLGDEDEGEGEDEDVTPEADDAEPVADSGIDGTTYESPTYGYTVEWDDSLWVAEESEELVDDGAEGMDRLLVSHREDGDPEGDLFSDLYVEGKEGYEGDPADCVEGEADLIAGSDVVTDFGPLDDSAGDPIEGESDAGGEFAAFTASIDDGESDPYELGYYIECRTLVEGESVVVITLVTLPETVEDEWDVAQDVVDTLEIPGGGGSAGDDEADDSADDAPSDDEADAEATEEDA